MRRAFQAIPLLVIAAALPLAAQSLRVYSEFVRFNAAGDPVAPAAPREILSPAIARNAYTSFQVVVQAPKGTEYRLHVGLNPENAVQARMYRESGGNVEPVELPYIGNETQVLWMDLWADRDAPVRRIKVEPQLKVNDDWVTYPMEVRVVEAIVPAGLRTPAAAATGEAMRALLCGTKIEIQGDPMSIAAMRFRNEQQDVALARRASTEDLRRLFGPCDAQPPESDPEWYYRIRDYLFRLR